ncbi:hypothetical protein [Roseateles paludis]|jgi:hypothetical protein|uniref:SMODS-associating 2TM beta-strand rich effector domain-containing protein n=1 Tax=Roseateles paludis TaxID=3145238 RepID=A0ABV0G3Y0_9BURK
MKHWRVSQRNGALAAGALIYSLIRTSLPKPLADDWLATLLPTLPVSLGFLQSKVVQSMLEGVGLVTLILLAEIVLLWWSARPLLGEWVYKSSAGNWGHVRMKIDKSEARLSYDVNLFKDESDLLHSIQTRQLRGCIGHGNDRFTLHDKDTTMIWYHVPERRTGESYYPERQGILTLDRDEDPDQLHARWARIGSMTSSLDAKSAPKTGDINKKDNSAASGTFLFFERRKVYEARHRAESKAAA